MKCHIKLFTLPMDLEKAKQFNRAMKVETVSSSVPAYPSAEALPLARFKQVPST